MRIDGNTRLLGLLGRPVGHSLSPRIQNHALGRLGENIAYLPFEVETEELGALVRLFPKIGGIGLNVTTPHKASVGALVRPGDDEVARTGIVNTVVYREGVPIGFSTDGLGFCSWLGEEGLESASEAVVLLGFGATARSLSYQLGLSHPLTIVTRQPADAEQTLQDWYAEGWPGLPARAISWSDPPPPRPVLVVGALPVEVARSAEVATWLGSIDPAAVVIDLNYGSGRTPLHDQARDRGLSAFDGTGLLVHQAARSLSLWLDAEVPVSLLREGLAGER